jgi:hypothetical protein
MHGLLELLALNVGHGEQRIPNGTAKLLVVAVSSPAEKY